MDPYNAVTRHSVTDSVTAFATGGQTGAVLLTTQINRVTTVTSGGDSVKLPPGKPGMEVTVINAGGGNSLNLYPAVGEQINAAGTDAAFALASTKVVRLYCTATGQWHTLLTA